MEQITSCFRNFEQRESLEWIRDAIAKQALPNLEEVEAQVRQLYQSVKPSERNLVAYFLFRLLRGHQDHMPSSNFPLYCEIMKTFLADQSAELGFRKIKDYTGEQLCEGLRKETHSKLSDHVEKYVELCRKMRLNPQDTLRKDLLVNGVAGQMIRQLRLTPDYYQHLCQEMLKWPDLTRI